MELIVYNEQGEEAGRLTFDEKVLGERVRRKLLHQVVVAYEANRRVGTHQAKSKGQRHGSGTKPWKQKHTGRARAGMKRSPLWRGGGNAFPPRPREYRKGLPQGMRHEALKSALLSKFRDDCVKVVDKFEYEKPQTSRFAKTLKKLGLGDSTCLVAALQPSEALVRSVRNMRDCLLLPSNQLNAYEVLKHKRLLMTREAVEKLAEAIQS